MAGNSIVFMLSIKFKFHLITKKHAHKIAQINVALKKLSFKLLKKFLRTYPSSCIIVLSTA